MNHLDLFAGIGGFRLALDIAGIPALSHYYSEIDPYACEVYQKNFPEAQALGDIRTISGFDLRSKHRSPWIVTGGFPCQDVSDAGKRAGLKGERSGLWYEMLRIIEELRPELVLIENVAALKGRGLIDILRGLDQAGFNAEWRTLSALEVGAIHTRKRLWIAAHPRDANGDVYPADHEQLAEHADGNVGTVQQPPRPTHAPITEAEWKAIEAEGSFHGQPLVLRKADGIPDLLDRNKALGNAIVPQCAAKVLREFLDCRRLTTACPSRTPSTAA
jgi:DNA (cytosine-5)-methyltransferase 1